MRYLMMFKPNEAPPPGEHACKKDKPEMRALLAKLTAEGVLLSTEGLLPSENGARVRLAGGKQTVTDGPFAEAKELVAGLAVVRVNSKAEAIEVAKQFLAIADGGEAEIREVMEA